MSSSWWWLPLRLCMSEWAVLNAVRLLLLLLQHPVMNYSVREYIKATSTRCAASSSYTTAVDIWAISLAGNACNDENIA